MADSGPVLAPPYGVLARILAISAAVNEREVCVVTASCELNDSMAAVASKDSVRFSFIQGMVMVVCWFLG